jgi:ABC-type transport system substrate-binding protein
MRLRLTVVLAIAVVLVFCVVSTPTPAAAQAKVVEKLVFASAGFEDTNRFWVVARPDHLQFDPFLETLLEVDPKTGGYTPRLAEKWEASPDFRRWTFWLRKGVQFHYGYGAFTAKDVAHSYALTQRPEAKMTLGPFWRGVEEVKAVNDYQVVFYMKKPATTMDYAVSRAGDFRTSARPSGRKGWKASTSVRPAPGRTATSDDSRASRSRTSGRTITGMTNRRSSSSSFGSFARSRRDWRCCCPARRTSPTCPASCRRTRSRRA